MKGFVYILQHSRSGHFYIGSTDNIERRIREHKRGTTATTKRLGSFHVCLVQEYPTLLIARKIERRLKALKRRDYVEKIIKERYIRMNVRD